MTKIRFLQALLLLLFVTTAYSQEYIVRLNSHINTLECKDISINEGIVKFTYLKNGKKLELSYEDVIAINFHKNKPYEIIIQSFKFDTLVGYVESINRRKIYIKGQFVGESESITTDNVFCIHFNPPTNTPKIDSYKNTFMYLYKKSFVPRMRIIKNDDSPVSISNVISLNNDTLMFEAIVKENIVKTHVKLGSIRSIINKDGREKKRLPYKKFYILSTDGMYEEIEFLKNVAGEKIEYDKIINNKVFNIRKTKESINGLFFYDYKGHQELLTTSYDSNNEIDFEFNNKEHKELKAKLDINSGIGYILAKAPEGATAEQKKYIDEMRMGITLDANLNVFVSNSFGIGVKYNHYSTSNSLSTVAEDNIKVNFIGGTVLSNTPLPNDKGYLYSGLSIGSLSEVNDAKLMGQDIKIQGKTIGMYLSIGLDLLVADNIALGFQSGLMIGYIREAEVNGQNLELEEPENLTRLDGMVGLKIYF